MREVIKSTFETNCCHAQAFITQKPTRMSNSKLVYKLSESLLGKFFKIPAKRRNSHTYFFGNIIQSHWVLKVLFHKAINGLDTLVIRGVDF